MTRILVTGSNDGIGAEIAAELARQGHDVIRHARNAERASGLSGEVVLGDLASLESTREMAAAVRALGAPEVVVHNAGTGTDETTRPLTGDGLERLFQINALAPLLLTALLPVPRRSVFVSSDSIVRGNIRLDDLQHAEGWTGDAAYADSKLAMAALAFALARKWPGSLINAVHPGWVSTKMSGYAAPLTVAEGADTPVWLAVSEDPEALVSGRFFQKRAVVNLNEQAYDTDVQDKLLAQCLELAGVTLPNGLTLPNG